jgi:acetyl-CoA carboxylase alpha subunit
VIGEGERRRARARCGDRVLNAEHATYSVISLRLRGHPLEQRKAYEAADLLKITAQDLFHASNR